MKEEAAKLPKFPKHEVLRYEAWFATVDRLVEQSQDIAGAEAMNKLPFYIPDDVFAENRRRSVNTDGTATRATTTTWRT